MRMFVAEEQQQRQNFGVQSNAIMKNNFPFQNIF
jgi:hypothetical protein